MSAVCVCPPHAKVMRMPLVLSRSVQLIQSGNEPRVGAPASRGDTSTETGRLAGSRLRPRGIAVNMMVCVGVAMIAFLYSGPALRLRSRKGFRVLAPHGRCGDQL